MKRLAAGLADATTTAPPRPTSSSPARRRWCRSSPTTTCSPRPCPRRCSRCSPVATTGSAPSTRPRLERVGEHDVCVAPYAHRNRTVHVMAVRASAEAIAAALAAVGGRRPPVRADNVVVDVYLPFTADPRDADASRGVDRAARHGRHSGTVRRVALNPLHAAVERMDLLTFRRAGRQGVRPYWMRRARRGSGGDRRDDLRGGHQVPGLHPMIARRLQIWRLSNFEVSRLPSTGDVHLFDCIGPATR